MLPRLQTYLKEAAVSRTNVKLRKATLSRRYVSSRCSLAFVAVRRSARASACGEKAPRHVNDPRITEAVQTFLKDTANGVRFFGHSVPEGTAGKTVHNDTSNVGWIRKGSAEDALIIEVNGWDTSFLTSWVATILLKERVGFNVAHIYHGGAAGTFGRMAPTEK